MNQIAYIRFMGLSYQSYRSTIRAKGTFSSRILYRSHANNL